MSVIMSTGLKQALLGTQGIDEVFTNCTIFFYTGAQPATADSAISGTLCAQATVNGGPFTPGSGTNGLNFDSPVAGLLSKAAAETWKIKGSAAATLGWGRIVGNAVDDTLTSTTLPRIDFSCGITSGDMRLSSVTTSVGSLTTIDTFTVSFL
jgi:hypothetical protein